MRDVVMNLGA